MRQLLSATALFVLGCCVFLSSIEAQELKSLGRVLVVVPSQGASVTSSSVNALVEELKAVREKAGIGPDLLPILRLNPSQRQHAKALAEIDVGPGAKNQVLLCQQGRDGWPYVVLFSATQPSDFPALVSQGVDGRPTEIHAHSVPPVTEAKAVVDPAIPTEIGLLLLHRFELSQEKALVSDFLTELGRHWLERYGRANPAPYPLGYYNLSEPTIRESVRAAFPQLDKLDVPQVALCFFRDGSPVRVLEVYEDLELPATLVRTLSASRSRHLADTLNLSELTEPNLPKPSAVELTDQQAVTVALARIHESAQQLWNGSAGDSDGGNKLARLTLLKIIELTRPTGRDDARILSEEVREELENYFSESLVLDEDSELVPIQARLLGLMKRLLD